MKTDTPILTRLKDYAAPSYKIKTIDLDFNLHASKTRVKSKMVISRLSQNATDFHLDGEEINLVSVKLDGKPVAGKNFKTTKTGLTLKNLPNHFTLEIESECNPSTNSSLMGLYISGGRFCTQCEAEGFRRITYFPDRPDMLSIFNVRIEADKEKFPTLLSNGNCTEQGDLKTGRHYAIWNDPFPKPCYLFALVAGKFDTVSDSFKTMSGRNIPLDIYVDPGDAARALYAMDALKRSMKWDEDAFGREYDLDRFMIVAVRDFNFGAMENKGLNIFNSSLLLADEASATDMNFELIESVIAHEYFHNWTGNRITCRDWFQLCLKEGFTVFRDQEFSASQRGAALQRIKDVKALRARQFPEDAGPLAHPVRPASYMKIDNFYTATIYEKGAELIRMLKTLLGDADFRKGCDYYFETLDGTAATIEQFIACFEHVSGQNLSQFMHWYEQAGTPNITIKTDYDSDAKTFDIAFTQNTRPTPGQVKKPPFLMPIILGLIDKDGHNFGEQTLQMNQETIKVHYENIDHEPSISMFRKFSAPVNIAFQPDLHHRLNQMEFDTDLFNRWEAGQSLARDILVNLSRSLESGKTPTDFTAMHQYTKTIVKLIDDKNLDMGFKALVMAQPLDGSILQACAAQGHGVDPLAVYQAGKILRLAIAQTGAKTIEALYVHVSHPLPFIPNATGAARRSLRNICLRYLIQITDVKAQKYARDQFETATNMTEEYSGLLALIKLGGPTAETALQTFYDKWEHTPLVIDKWFSAYAGLSGFNALEKISALTNNPAYKDANPNRVRALIGGFAATNPETFHNIDGSGYKFFADNVLMMDKVNPQLAARLLGVFSVWTTLDLHRQSLIKAQLTRILKSKPSANVYEIATKSLGA